MKRSREKIISEDDNHHVDGNIIISNTFEIENNSAEEPTSKKQTLQNSSNCSSYFSLGCELMMDKENADQDDYLKAMQYFMKGSEEGCLESTHKIGYLYNDGLGVDQDYSKAFEWYMKAAEGGLSKSQCNIGFMYQQGEGVPQDYSKAMEWCLKAAENNDAFAQYNIGLIYEDGRGVLQDYSKAFEWYLKSAENNDADAQFNIGLMYKHGRGVQQDYSKAFEWYLKAAEAGLSKSQCNIGFMYKQGEGVSKDYSKAMEWYLKSAENNDTNAQFNIGLMYDNGLGVQQDYSKAMEWYLKASENNIAQFNIGLMYDDGLGVSQDYSKAFEWYLKSASNGNMNAVFNIGYSYQHGQGVEKDLSKAFEWYLKAAEKNDAGAQFNIGLMYEKGEGVSQDYSKSMEWYLKAAEKGNRIAKVNISTMYRNGFGVEMNLKKVIYWLSRYFNDDNITFIENPDKEFGIQHFEIQNEELTDLEILKSNNENLVIRFEKKDFKISQKDLKSCKYLQTMMNSNWKDFNSKENDCIILDLTSIQHEIFQHNTGESEPVDIYELFEKYIEYLTNDTIPNGIEFEMKLKLIELSRYLQDDECILKIVKESSLLIRMYILSIFEITIELIDCAIASCYVMDNEIEMNEIPLKVIEWLLNETELSSTAKKKLLQLTQINLTNSQTKMKPINDSKFIHHQNNINDFKDDNNIIHVLFRSNLDEKKQVDFNNQKVTFGILLGKDDNKNSKIIINCSENISIFGVNSNIYIQFNTNRGSDEITGFWIENKLLENNTIFNLPEITFTTIHLIIYQ